MPDVAKTLPDPLQTGGADLGSNADEILSQLAGEEIDRLLAEADSPQSQTTSPAAPVAVAKTTPTFHPTPKASAPDPVADDDLSRQLDDLFNELNQEIAAAPAAQSATPEPPAPETVAHTEVEPPKPVVTEVPQVVAADPAQDTNALESDVLASTALAAVPEIPAREPEVRRPASAKPQPSEEPALSPLLRPIAWISALLPETALDWMGKVAILTTVNAMAILVYVLIRRH